MEIIKKIINLDSLKSHRPGLLPYIAFNEDGDIRYIPFNEDYQKGNYGGFVCDICEISAYTKTFSDGSEKVFSATTYNLKYQDIMRHYNNVQMAIKDGIYLKSSTINDEKVIACNIETINEKRFYPISSFENKNLCEISNSQEADLRYVYTPKHIDGFTSISNYYIENSGSDSTSIILLDDLSAIEAANVWWSEIKDKFTFLNDWETQIPDSIVPDFHFAYIVEKYLLGLAELTEDIVDDTPNFVYYADSANISNIYGQEMVEYIENYFSSLIVPTNSNINDNVYYMPPVIEIPILLENDTIDDKIYSPYIYSVSGEELTTITVDDEERNVVEGTFIVEDIIAEINSGLVSDFHTYEEYEIFVESKLGSLRSPYAYEISDGQYGMLENFIYYIGDSGISGSCLFECTYREISTSGASPEISSDVDRIVSEIGKFDFISETKEVDSGIVNTYVWWECRMVTGSNLSAFTCADGEEVKANEINKYQNVTVLSCLNNLIGAPDDGDKYYFMARFDNGYKVPDDGPYHINNLEIIPMKLPYNIGEPLNITTFGSGDNSSKGCDFVSAITYGTNVEIKYVLGAQYEVSEDENGRETGYTITSNEIGIHYKEILAYNENSNNGISCATFWIDGSQLGDIYYYDVNLDTNAVDVLNPDYNLSTKVRMAQIIGMSVSNSEWHRYPMFTKEGVENLREIPKYDLNIIFNRGAGAAWEKHFKLSECNTMNDLVNYGNNYFNI